MYKFAAASENKSIVFGASRSGYCDRQVNDWIKFMKVQNSDRINCLLEKRQLDRYANLLDKYKQKFGVDRVCWTPIKDFHL
ncbi:MAG: protein phosphatase, partial [Xenococcaceae cyanobacterium]